MKPLLKIIQIAKDLKKQYPNKYIKWTEYVKEASKIYRSINK